MTDMPVAPEMWFVVDKVGSAVQRKSQRTAELQAELWDLEYPSLAPHRVVKYIHAGEDHADHTDPAIPQEAA